MPPRTLKAPMGVWFSCFTHTSAPVRLASKGHAYNGVAGTTVRTSGTAASNSARVNKDIDMAPQPPTFATLSYRGLSPVSTRPGDVESAEKWIPGARPGMTVSSALHLDVAAGRVLDGAERGAGGAGG